MTDNDKVSVWLDDFVEEVHKALSGQKFPREPAAQRQQLKTAIESVLNKTDKPHQISGHSVLEHWR